MGWGTAKEVLRKSQTVWITRICVHKQQQPDNVMYVWCFTRSIRQHNGPQAHRRLFYKEDDDPLLLMSTEYRIIILLNCSNKALGGKKYSVIIWKMKHKAGFLRRLCNNLHWWRLWRNQKGKKKKKKDVKTGLTLFHSAAEKGGCIRCFKMLSNSIYSCLTTKLFLLSVLGGAEFCLPLTCTGWSLAPVKSMGILPVTLTGPEFHSQV